MMRPDPVDAAFGSLPWWVRPERARTTVPATPTTTPQQPARGAPLPRSRSLYVIRSIGTTVCLLAVLFVGIAMLYGWFFW